LYEPKGNLLFSVFWLKNSRFSLTLFFGRLLKRNKRLQAAVFEEEKIACH